MPLPSVVEAETSGVGDVLGRIARMVEAHGGGIHPDARLIERDGQLSVRWRGGAVADDEVLLRVPRSLLVPVDGIAWQEGAADLRPLGSIGHLSRARQEVLGMQCELFTACGKLPWTARTHPRAALLDEAEVLTALRAMRPGFAKDSECVADAFIATRVFGLEPADGADADGPFRVLMPLIDLLNNHPNGAPYVVDTVEMSTSVRLAADSDECFARYGHRSDCMDLALAYGYLDASVSYARSIPCTVEVDGVGVIEVLGRRQRRLHPLDPPLARLTDAGIRFSHLTFEPRHPDRMRAWVGLAVRSLLAKRGVSAGVGEQRADAAVDVIAEANLVALQHVLDAAAGGRSSNPAVELVAAAGGRQLTIIEGTIRLR